jgi:hypothetical protein
LLQLPQDKLGLVENPRLNLSMLKQVASNEDKVYPLLNGMAAHHIPKGQEKIFAPFWTVVAVAAQMHIGQMQKGAGRSGHRQSLSANCSQFSKRILRDPCPAIFDFAPLE